MSFNSKEEFDEYMKANAKSGDVIFYGGYRDVVSIKIRVGTCSAFSHAAIIWNGNLYHMDFGDDEIYFLQEADLYGFVMGTLDKDENTEGSVFIAHLRDDIQNSDEVSEWISKYKDKKFPAVRGADLNKMGVKSITSSLISAVFKKTFRSINRLYDDSYDYKKHKDFDKYPLVCSGFVIFVLQMCGALNDRIDASSVSPQDLFTLCLEKENICSSLVNINVK